MRSSILIIKEDLIINSLMSSLKNNDNREKNI